MRAVVIAMLVMFVAATAVPAVAQDEPTNNVSENVAEASEQAEDMNRIAPQSNGGGLTPDSDANEDVVGDSGEALVKLFVLAVLLEFALALIFNWRPFVVAFDGRGVKTIVSLIAALVVVYALRPNSVVELMTDYGARLGAGDIHVARIIEAMIIAGGSAGVYNLLVALGIRTRRAEEVVRRPKPEEAWISIGLRSKTKTVGPVRIRITEHGKGAELIGHLNQPLRRRGIASFFLRDPNRLPASGGLTLQPGVVYTVSAEGKNAAGQTIPDTWGPEALAKGAIVDIEFDM